MKKSFLILLMFSLMSTFVEADNYPFRSDYLWVTNPDHSDWIYATSENANIEVELYKYGVPCNVPLTYSIANDMLESGSSQKINLKNGRATINIGTRTTPGFLDLRLKACVDGDTVTHHVKVGFSVDKIKPFTEEPSDFRKYWTDNIAEMHKFPLTWTKETAKEYSNDKVDCYLIKLILNRQGQSIYGYLFLPKGAKPSSCPVILCPPGAGIKTIREPLHHIFYAENGCIRLEIEIHGLDPRLSEETFRDINAAFNGKENGYLANGIDNPDRYYMKRVYLALVRCVDLLTSLPEWDGRNVIVQGGSQGGALSIVAARLDQRITQCVVNHPALSDMAAYSMKGRTGGYPHFNRMKDMFTDANMRTMTYYDVVNFARYVKAFTFMTWGYNDDTCPPTTSYAVWNTLKCRKESLLTPINEHWTSDATDRLQCTWILKHLIK